jgi:hypothetical protein
MKKSLLLVIILLLPLIGYSQFSMRHQTTKVQPADSIDIQYYSKKNGWGAAAQVFGLNMGVWGFDRYVLKSDFAYIGFRSISDNIKGGFYWDNDQIGTNMFLHPYHGSLYFNSARSRGFNYWMSGAYALGGSAMWELFMENEHPSINDIIATPVGGLALGEVFYRASDLALDDRTRGGERFKHELIAFLIAPSRGLTRIINGDAWKVRSTPGRQFGVPMISAELSAGVRVLELRDEVFDEGTGFTTILSMEYGDRYDNENTKPYDYFSIRAEINIQKSQPALGQINVIGRLWASDLIDSKKDFLGIGVYQHFDYYDSDTISSVSNEIPYKIAAPASFGIGLIHKSKRFRDWDFNSYIHLNGILLGAALSDHYKVAERNYNLGSGFGAKGGINISYKDKISISGYFENYRLFTWKGYKEGIDLSTVDYNELNAQGDKSSASLTTSSLKAEVKLRKQLYLTGIGTLFKRSTHYKYFEDVYSVSGEGKLMLTYKF